MDSLVTHLGHTQMRFRAISELLALALVLTNNDG